MTCLKCPDNTLCSKNVQLSHALGFAIAAISCQQVPACTRQRNETTKKFFLSSSQTVVVISPRQLVHSCSLLFFYFAAWTHKITNEGDFISTLLGRKIERKGNQCPGIQFGQCLASGGKPKRAQERKIRFLGHPVGPWRGEVGFVGVG